MRVLLAKQAAGESVRAPKVLHGALAIALVAALAGCASTPAEDDPMQIKLNDLDGRVARIERVVSNQSLVQLAQNLDAAQADIRKLRGRVEELENANEVLRKQQRDLYSDLDKRVAVGGAGTAGAGGANVAAGAGGAGGALGGAGFGAGPGGPQGGGAPYGAAGAAGAVGSGGPGGAGSAGGAAGVGGAAGAAGAAGQGGAGAATGSSVEQRVYTQAFDALKAGSYSVAITGFKDFLSSYPASGLAENAQYWLGEAYYVTRDYDNASGAFRTVLQKWPDSRKGPDAMLKLGFTQYELKRYADSRKTLEEVTRKFPDSDAAKLAGDRLKRIPANAH
jgi:tol-pal system protein YbgF